MINIETAQCWRRFNISNWQHFCARNIIDCYTHRIKLKTSYKWRMMTYSRVTINILLERLIMTSNALTNVRKQSYLLLHVRVPSDTSTIETSDDVCYDVNSCLMSDLTSFQMLQQTGFQYLIKYFCYKGVVNVTNVTQADSRHNISIIAV